MFEVLEKDVCVSRSHDRVDFTCRRVSVTPSDGAVNRAVADELLVSVAMATKGTPHGR